MNSLYSYDTKGQTYSLGGPEVMSVRELVEFVYSTIREPYHGIYTPAGERPLHLACARACSCFFTI